MFLISSLEDNAEISILEALSRAIRTGPVLTPGYPRRKLWGEQRRSWAVNQWGQVVSE